MLSAKPWKADAIARLVLSVMVCVVAGWLLMGVQHFLSAGGGVSAKIFYPLAVTALGCLAATLVLISKPWSPEALLWRLEACMICFCVGFLLVLCAQQLSGVGGAGSSIWRVVIASLSFQGAGLVLIARFLNEHQVGWREAFGFGNRWRRAVMLGVLVALFFLPLGWGLQQASALVMTHLPHWLQQAWGLVTSHLPHWLQKVSAIVTTHLANFKMEPEEQLPVHVLRVSMSWAGRITLGVAAILLAPVAEEILFRGILYAAIKQAGFPRIALWGTVLLFAYVHMNAVSFLPLAALAMVLTALYERTDNLLAPIVAHAMFNALNFVTLFLVEQA